MPRNGSGTYTLPRDWTTDAGNGTPFGPDKFDQQDQDIADAINDVGPPDSLLKWVPPDTNPNAVPPGTMTEVDGDILIKGIGSGWNIGIKNATDHAAKTDNPHGVTKAQVGLADVDNTSDADKPISTATQDALDVLGAAIGSAQQTVNSVSALAGAQAFGALLYATKSEIDGDIDHPDKTGAWVYADPAAANNGVYVKSGASGIGSWTRATDLPFMVLPLTVTGGTANAIQASSPYPVPAADRSAILILTPLTDNTDAVTLQLNSGTPLPLHSNSGVAIPAGFLKAGSTYPLFRESGEYRSLIDTTAEANAAIAVAAAATAVAAKEAAEAAVAGVDMPPVAANSMIVDNSDGTLRETKTFPQVRALLEVPSFADLAYIDATQYGCHGDGSDQTTALQAIIDGLPTEGGNILLKGDVRWTTLSAYQRRNIRFIGLGGYGSGSGQRTLFRCLSGALGSGNPAFNLRQTMNVSFEKLFIDSRDAAFTGTLLDWGDLVTGSALMAMTDCYLYVLSDVGGARGINIYGATQGKFERVKFAGAAILVQMQNATGVGWCNQHLFLSCSINPTSNKYPVNGSGEGITWQNGNVQASSGDGIGRFWSTNLTQPFRGVNIIGNTFYDVLTSGGTWANFYTGNGLNLIGNLVGGAQDVSAANNYGFLVGGGTDGVSGTPLGVSGGQIVGNHFRFMTAGISFSGSAGTYDNARAMIVGVNYAFGTLSNSNPTALYSNVGSTVNMIWLPSEQYGSPNAFGTHFNLRGLPTSATGLQTGDIWNNAGVLAIVP